MFDVTGLEAQRNAVVMQALANPYDTASLSRALGTIDQMDRVEQQAYAGFQQFQMQQAALQQQLQLIQSILNPRQGQGNNPLAALLGGGAGGAAGGIEGLLGQLTSALGGAAAGGAPPA
jgi:hypothetical protein